MSTLKTYTDVIEKMLDRVEKIERAGATSVPNEADRAASLQVITECFDLLRKNPPLAYIKFMDQALSQPSSVKKEYVNRSTLFGRLAGYALLLAVESEDIFQRIMAINEGPK